MSVTRRMPAYLEVDELLGVPEAWVRLLYRLPDPRAGGSYRCVDPVDLPRIEAELRERGCLPPRRVGDATRSAPPTHGRTRSRRGPCASS